MTKVRIMYQCLLISFTATLMIQEQFILYDQMDHHLSLKTNSYFLGCIIKLNWTKLFSVHKYIQKSNQAKRIFFSISMVCPLYFRPGSRSLHPQMVKKFIFQTHNMLYIIWLKFFMYISKLRCFWGQSVVTR